MQRCLTLILLMWRIWWAPNNASRWQVGFISAFKWLMERKLLRLNYLYTSKGEVHIQVRIEEALLIVPVVFVILFLLRIYRSCFVPLQINKSLLIFYTIHLSQIFSSLLSQLSRCLFEKMWLHCPNFMQPRTRFLKILSLVFTYLLHVWIGKLADTWWSGQI